MPTFSLLRRHILQPWKILILDKQAIYVVRPLRVCFVTTRPAAVQVTPAIVFVALYSFLPHKELRFIFPAIPLLNAIAALGMVKLYKRFRPQQAGDDPSPRPSTPWLAVLGCLLTSVALSLVFLRASSLNYPGGVALARLHERVGPLHPPQIVPGQRPLVHIDNLAAISGVSRFGEVNAQFRLPYETVAAPF